MAKFVHDRGQVIVLHVLGRPLLAVLTAGLVAATTVAASVIGNPAGPAPAATTHRSPTLRGIISAVDGDSWTVTPDHSGPVVVELMADTVFGSPRRPAERSAFVPGTAVGIVGRSVDGQVVADRVLRTATSRHRTAPAGSLSATTPLGTPAPAPAPVPAGPNACAVTADLAAAVSSVSGQHEQSAAAVIDTVTGAYYSAGDADKPFNTASVVKVFVAANLLLTGQMTGETEATATTMITQSDDDDTDALYGLAGGDQVVTTVGRHYGIADLGTPPADTGQWGETKITANGLAHFYAAVKKDPLVWPWLSKAMAAATRTGDDGTDQYFGIPSASNDWAVKQGWMVGLGPGATYNSTGYVQGTRYVVVLLTSGAAGLYGHRMAAAITQMARLALPGGVPGNPSPASASCPP